MRPVRFEYELLWYYLKSLPMHLWWGLSEIVLYFNRGDDYGYCDDYRHGGGDHTHVKFDHAHHSHRHDDQNHEHAVTITTHDHHHHHSEDEEYKYEEHEPLSSGM